MDELPNIPIMYVAVEKKEVINELDLAEPVVMTMLNQLEKVEGSFFKVASTTPA